MTENERLRKTHVSADIERDLSGQVDKLTANIKGKERQIDDLNQQLRKATSAKHDLETTNNELQVIQHSEQYHYYLNTALSCLDYADTIMYSHLIMTVCYLY